MVEINRGNGLKDRVTFTLRILNLDVLTSKKVSNILTNTFLIEEIHLLENNTSLILVENIDTYNDYSIIINLMKDKVISRENINIFISLTTSFDMAGFTVPEKISSFYIDCGGSIDFSTINLID